MQALTFRSLLVQFPTQVVDVNLLTLAVRCPVPGSFCVAFMFLDSYSQKISLILRMRPEHEHTFC